MIRGWSNNINRMSPELNIARKAATAAATVLNQISQRDALLNVEKKKENDFVSRADKNSEAAIIYTLQTAYPDDAIVAEESGRIGPENAERVWIVDPLDGTNNFLHDIPHYAISIALMEKDVLTHALIYDPVRDEFFTASKGRGAYLDEHRIRVNRNSSLDGAIIATGFPFRDRDNFSRYMVQFKSIFKQAGDIRRAGSAALDLAYVAAGRVDGFWESGLEIWDIAAGALIIEEAGGQCLDFSAGKKYLKSGNIIAGNLKVSAAIAAKIKQTEPA
ncbi:inositol monophosphatase family protein [Marinicella sp. W31]|uniref:inositol monophosphatase family protein n=1 Tax=Marinicella sp. W31 TaxID=3023713 RepID=UPI003757D858